MENARARTRSQPAGRSGAAGVLRASEHVSCPLKSSHAPFRRNAMIQQQSKAGAETKGVPNVAAVRKPLLRTGMGYPIGAGRCGAAVHRESQTSTPSRKYWN